jgi:hypothetical protein
MQGNCFSGLEGNPVCVVAKVKVADGGFRPCSASVYSDFGNELRITGIVGMPNELARLITTYRWLQQELDLQKDAGSRSNAVHVAEQLEAIFLQIVRHPSEDPSICYRQIEFLLGVLAEGPPDRKMRRLLRDEVLVHVKRLATKIDPLAEQNVAKAMASDSGARRHQN